MKIIYHKHDAIPQSIRAFWRTALREREPSQTLTAGPDWFEMKTESSSAPSFVAVVANDCDELQALLPCIEGHWDLHFGKIGRMRLRKRLTVLTVAGGNVICPAPLPPRDLGQVCEQILDKHPNTDAIQFYRIALSAKGNDDAAGQNIQARGCFRHVVIDNMPHYLLRIPENVHGVKDLRSAKTLSELRRYERRLAEEAGGTCRLVEIRCRKDWEPYKEAIESMMNGAWQARWLGHDFWLENTERVARRGWLRSFLLMAGDRAAAFMLAYQGEDQFMLEQTGYDSRLHQFSPGQVMTHKIVEAVLQNDRPAYIDLSYGEAEWKRQLANETVNVSSLLIVRRRPALLLWFSVYGRVRGIRDFLFRTARSMPFWRRLKQRLKRKGA
ncbi:MAG: GNAT family N-acetyltransferase [Thermoguttaceae bacterium]